MRKHQQPHGFNSAPVDPWELLKAIEDDPPLSPGDRGVDHFLDLVSTRPSWLERDALLARGFFVCGYRLADALQRVELLLLDRLLDQTDARSGGHS